MECFERWAMGNVLEGFARDLREMEWTWTWSWRVGSGEEGFFGDGCVSGAQLRG